MVKLEDYQYLNGPDGRPLLEEPEVGSMVTRTVRRLGERNYETHVGIVVDHDPETGKLKVLWSEDSARKGPRPGHDGTLEVG